MVEHLKMFACVILVLIVVVEAAVIPKDQLLIENFASPEDANLKPKQLIEKYGYRGETHFVTTGDGYVLEMHRITGPNSNPSPAGKQPVLVMHGLLASSVDWIITGPECAFGYFLADEGYDVWLGNNRGNTFSRKHIEHEINTEEFWQFSWHEIGMQDVPAMVDHVLNATNREKLIYTGHSQGTTAFFIMTAELPEYQNKVQAMFALAPVAHLTHISSPFYRVLAKFGNNVQAMMSVLGLYEFRPTSDFLKEVMALACDDDAWSQPICMNLIFLVAGPGSDQLNSTMLPAILGHIPAGSSVKQIIHFAQVINTRKFRMYDYGLIENWRRYKRFTPPKYDLSKIKVPVSLHYASNDIFATPKDVDRLHRELGNSIGKLRVPHDTFNHLDFTWASKGRQLLYTKIVGLMKRFQE